MVYLLSSKIQHKYRPTVYNHEIMIITVRFLLINPLIYMMTELVRSIIESFKITDTLNLFLT